jgi:predicted HAD superfamily Cof-like phosphohydrolase
VETLFADVRAFLAMFPPRSPSEIREARVRILTEEAGELAAEVAAGNGIRTLAEGVDVIYSAIGALVEAGWTADDFLAAWTEVARANAAKIPPPPSDPSAKATKPPGWTPPDIEGALRARGAAVGA